MDETELRKHRCCFTGHRPEKLNMSEKQLGFHWGDGWTERFQNVLAQADLVRCISKEFSFAAYQRRNQWMVDHCALVIAVFNGEAGGARNTLMYAKEKNVSCNIIKLN